jgi:hypothetical protein
VGLKSVAEYVEALRSVARAGGSADSPAHALPPPVLQRPTRTHSLHQELSLPPPRRSTDGLPGGRSQPGLAARSPQPARGTRLSTAWAAAGGHAPESPGADGLLGLAALQARHSRLGLLGGGRAAHRSTGASLHVLSAASPHPPESGSLTTLELAALAAARGSNATAPGAAPATLSSPLHAGPSPVLEWLSACDSPQRPGPGSNEAALPAPAPMRATRRRTHTGDGRALLGRVSTEPPPPPPHAEPVVTCLGQRAASGALAPLHTYSGAPCATGGSHDASDSGSRPVRHSCSGVPQRHTDGPALPPGGSAKRPVPFLPPLFARIFS